MRRTLVLHIAMQYKSATQPGCHENRAARYPKNQAMKYFKLTALLILLSGAVNAQDTLDIDKMLDEEMNKKKSEVSEFAEATFKSSRIINGHSIENTQRGVMDFRIAHRFGTLNRGFYELFGLDNASMRMSFDFGLTDRLMVGVGRSTFEKQYDAFFKYRILRQRENGKMPVSLSLMASTMLRTLKYTDNIDRNFSDKLQYAYQLILARKFSSDFSLQLMPTLVHYNLVPKANDPNDLISLGVGGRLKISQRVSVNAEYYYQLPDHKLPGTYNSLSVGFDIETGGHVFQLHFTNSTGMTERTFITETTGQWGQGDIHFGFNISRVFQLSKRR